MFRNVFRIPTMCLLLLSMVLVSACDVKYEDTSCTRIVFSYDNSGPTASSFSAYAGSTLIGTDSGTVSSGRTTITINFTPPQPSGTKITILAAAVPTPVEFVTYTCGTGATPLFNDGRLNNFDAGQTAAIYCKADGSIEVLAIYKGVGYRAFTASAKEIAKVPTHPEKNTLIKQGNGARLYRLTTGELQVNRAEDGPTAKDYVFIFKDCTQQ